ncbi:hypothetical protein THRCLA_06579 [Thraustotheca clavata]|uniref:Uncharacterized protein n=1 Tax=Thraustotheca clavata TaxID=74557 RepID=A0A1V9ZMG4_9STRA|nr:hypothetical protein THRCLA_06579 [Thraustotheca clavata]
MYRFYPTPIQLSGNVNDLASALSGLMYQTPLFRFNNHVDTVNIVISSSENNFLPVSDINIFIPPAHRGRLMWSTPPPPVVTFGSFTLMPSFVARYIAADTIGGSNWDVVAPIVNLTVSVGPGAQFELPYKVNTKNLAYSSSLLTINERLQSLNITKSPFPDIPDHYYFENIVVDVMISAPVNPPVVISFPIVQGVLSGFITLQLDLNGIVDKKWCQPSTSCICTTSAIYYPFTGAAIQSQLTTASASCSQPPLQSIQTLNVQFPIPLSQLTPDKGTFTLAFAGYSTTSLSGISTAAMVQSALLALPSMAQMTGKLIVTSAIIDNFTMQLVFAFSPLLGTVSPITVGSSTWFASSASIYFSWIQQPSLVVNFASAVTCTTTACTIQFLADMPHVSIGNNALVNSISQQTASITISGNWDSINASAQVFYLAGNPVKINTSESQLQAILSSKNLENINVSTIAVQPPRLKVWRISYSTWDTSMIPLPGSLVPSPNLLMQVNLVDNGRKVPTSKLDLSIFTQDSVLNATIFLRFQSPEVKIYNSTIQKTIVQEKFFYINLASVTLTAPPGQVVSLHDAIKVNTSLGPDELITTTIVAVQGNLSISFPYTYHVQYLCGSPGGNQKLCFQVKVKDLLLIFSSLQYTSPMDYYGTDNVSISSVNLTKYLMINIPFTQGPPSIFTQNASLTLSEDTSIKIPIMNIIPSMYTLRGCDVKYSFSITAKNGIIASLLMHTNSSQATFYAEMKNVSDLLSSLQYIPFKDYAGTDRIVVSLKQLPCLSLGQDTNAVVEFPVLVEPVPDPIQILLNDSIIFVISSEPTPLPAIQLISFDVAPWMPEVYVQISFNAQHGKIGFTSASIFKDTTKIGGSINQINLLLATLTYQLTSLGTGNDTILFTVADMQPNGFTTSISIQILYENKPPTLRLLQKVLVVDEDTAVEISQVIQCSNSDIDINLKASKGFLSVYPEAHWQTTLGLNSLKLQQVLYKPPLDFNGEDTITFYISDVQESLNLPIIVQSVNDVPSIFGNITSLDNVSVGEKAKLCGIQISDIESSIFPPTTYRLIVTSFNGNIMALPYPGIFVRSIENGVDIQGSYSAINKFLASCTLSIIALNEGCDLQLCVYDGMNSTCQEFIFQFLPRRPTIPQLIVKPSQVIVQEDGDTMLESYFSLTEATEHTTIQFDSANGIIDLSAFNPGSCCIATKNSISGTSSCINSLLKTQHIYYRPRANIFGEDIITLSTANSSEKLDVWIQSVNDPVAWNAQLDGDLWNIDDRFPATFYLTNYGNFNLNNSVDPIDSLIQLTLTVNNGIISYSYLPGLSYEGTSSNASFVVVTGTILQLNNFLEFIEYDPRTTTSNNDVMQLTATDGPFTAAISVNISITCQPRFALTKFSVEMTMGQAIELTKIAEYASCGSNIDEITIQILAQTGLVRLSPALSWSQTINATVLPAELKWQQIYYQALNSTGFDIVSVVLVKRGISSEQSVDINIVEQNSIPMLICSQTPLIIANEIASQLESPWVDIQNYDPFPIWNLNISTSVPVQLRIQPNDISISASSFSWQTSLRFTGSISNLIKSLQTLQVRSNSTISDPITGEMIMTLSSKTSDVKRSCAIPVAVEPTNSAPVILPLPNTCGVEINDPDIALKGWLSTLTIGITATEVPFSFQMGFPSPIQILNETLSFEGAWSSVWFNASLADANKVVKMLLVNQSNSIQFMVSDNGHNLDLPPLQTSRQIFCFINDVPQLRFQTPNFTCTGPCLLSGISVSSKSTVPIQVSGTTVMTFTPEIQTVQTSVDKHLDQIYDIVVTTSAAGTITLQLQWSSASGVSGANNVVMTANAVASAMEEFTGGSSGFGIGNSVQSLFQSAFPSNIPIKVTVVYGHISQQHWRVQFSTLENVLWHINLNMVSATNGIVAQVYPSQLLSEISGAFSLEFQGELTVPLSTSASSLDVQIALEALSQIDTVEVSRNQYPDRDGGYVWTITFYDTAYNIPQLKGITKNILPQQQSLVNGNPVGCNAIVQVQQISLGYGVAEVHHINLSAIHVNPVIQITTASTTTQIVGTFTLAIQWANGTTSSSSPIEYNAVAMISDEGIDKSLGGRPGQSLQSNLLQLLPGIATSISRSGPTSTQSYTWTITLLNSPANLPNLAINSLTGTLNSPNVNIAISVIQSPNALGGVFTLTYRNATTPPLSIWTSAAQLKQALLSLPTIQTQGIGNIAIQQSARDLQNGCKYAIMFLERFHEVPFAGDFAQFFADGTQLTGLGAFVATRAVNMKSCGTLQLNSNSMVRSSSLSFQQRHFEMDIMLSGLPNALNSALAQLTYIPSPNWFGNIYLHLNAKPGSSWISHTPIKINATPNFSYSRFTWGTIYVLEDIPISLSNIGLETNMLSYSTISLFLAVKFGNLLVQKQSVGQSFNVTTTIGMYGKAIARIMYQGKHNYFGVEELRIGLNGRPPQTFRFNVHAVNDPPYLHINGSTEGYIDTKNLPPLQLSILQGTTFVLPYMWIEGDSVHSESLSFPLRFTVLSTLGEIRCLSLGKTFVENATMNSLIFRGSLLSINQAIQTLQIKPPQAFTGVIGITLVILDLETNMDHVRLLQIQVQPVLTLPTLSVNSSIYMAQEDIDYSFQLALQLYSAESSKQMQSASLYRSMVLQPDSGTSEWRYVPIQSNGTQNPQWFASFSNRLYFAADHPTLGRELFFSDGTSLFLFADLNPGFQSSSPAHLAAFNNYVYFAATGLDTSWQLSTQYNGCNAQRSSFSLPNILFVVASSTTWNPHQVYDCPLGYSWLTTAQGQDIFTGTRNATDYVYWNECGWHDYTYLGNTRRYFRFSDSANTNAMKHAGRRADHPIEYTPSTVDFAGIVCGKQLQYSPLQSQLWRMDGSVASKFNMSLTNPKWLTAISATFLFFQGSTIDAGEELYRTDGTYTYRNDLNPGPASSSPSWFTAFNGQVYFAATSNLGRELWVTSITGVNPWSANVAADIQIGTASSNPTWLTVCGSLLYFSADDGIHGRELWTFNGATAQIVKDLLPGSDSSDPKYLTQFQSKIYFQAQSNNGLGIELYVSDGTQAGTFMLVDILPGVESSTPSYLNVQTQVRGGVSVSTLVFCIGKETTSCVWYGCNGIIAWPLWSSTQPLLINPDTFQVASFKSMMFFPLQFIATTISPASPSQQYDLLLNVSFGSLLFKPFTTTPKMSMVQYQLHGTIAQLNAAMKNLIYRAPLNWNSKMDTNPLVQIGFQWSTGDLVSTAKAWVFVQPMYDPPVVLAQGAIASPFLHTSDNLSPLILSVPAIVINEDTQLNLSQLSIRAVDCLGQNNVYILDCLVVVSLQVFNGSLTLQPTLGVNRLQTSVNSLILSGSVPGVNSAINNTIYMPRLNHYGTDSLIITSSLQDLRTFPESSLQIPIQLNSLNDAPYIIMNSDYVEAIEDEKFLLMGISAIDVDSSSVFIEINATIGTISIRDTVGIQLLTGSGNNDNQVKFFGKLAGINSALSTLEYSSKRNWNSAIGDMYDSFTIKISDEQGLSSVWTMTVNVAPEPDPILVSTPNVAFSVVVAATPPQTPLYTLENTVMAISNLVLSCVDARPTSVITVTLRVNFGKIAVGYTPGVQQYASSFNVLSLTGTYTLVNSALSGLIYTPLQYFNGIDSLYIEATAYDEEIQGSFSIPGQCTFNITIIPVNNAPIWTNTEKSLQLEKSTLDQILPIKNVSFNDPDSTTLTNFILELTIDSKDGFIYLNPLASVTFLIGSPNRKKFVVLRGTQNQLNAALSGLTFELDMSIYNSKTFNTITKKQPRISLTIDDLGNIGNGGSNVISTWLFIHVVSLQNEPPIITLPSLSIFPLEDIPISLSGLVIDDPDIRDTYGSLMQVNLSCLYGQVVVSVQPGLSILYSNNTLVLQGSIEVINYGLNSSNYVSAQNYFGQDEITIIANDLGNTGTGGPQVAIATIAVSVMPVCDGPSWKKQDNSLSSTAEDTPLLLHPPIIQDPEKKLLELYLQVDYGGILLALHTGLHIISSSVNDGVSSVFYSNANITGTAEDLNAALAGLIYIPSENWNSRRNYGLVFDRLHLSLSGVACNDIPSTIQILIEVTEVNDSPVITLPPWASPNSSTALFPLSEDEVAFLGPIVVADPDAFTLEVTVNCSNGTLNLLSSPPTLYFSAGAATKSSQIVFVGTLHDINAALSDVRFVPGKNYVGLVAIKLSVTDFSTFSTATISVSISAVEDPINILLPEEIAAVQYNKTVRLGNVYFPEEITALHQSPPPFTLYMSEMVQPDTKSGIWGTGIQWRNTLVNSTVVSPSHFATFNGHIVYQAFTPELGYELWQSKGTTTTLLADLWPGTMSSNPTEMLVFSRDSKLYFIADGIDTSWMISPWLADTCQGFRKSSISSSIAYAVSGSNIWDPSAVHDCPEGYQWATTAQGSNYFIGRQEGNGSHSEPLTYFGECGWNGYIWGGQSRQCFRFSDSKTTGGCKHSGQRDSFQIQTDFSTQNFAGVVCIAQDSTQTQGRGLWRTDGKIVQRITSGALNPKYLVEYNSQLYFQANTYDLGTELWTFDGNQASVVADLAIGSRSSNPRYLTAQGSKLYFAADSDTFGAELWLYDGINAVLVYDICQGTCSSNPQYFAPLANWLIFQATDATHGTELWKTNGVTTVLLMDIAAGQLSSLPSYLTTFNNKVYFQANDYIHGNELWVADGISTSLLIDLIAGVPSSSPQYFTVASAGIRSSNSVPQSLYFIAQMPDGAEGIYFTDGTSSGTTLLSAQVPMDHLALDTMPKPAFGVAQNAIFYPSRDTLLPWNTVWNGVSPKPLASLLRPQSIFLVDFDMGQGLVEFIIQASAGLLTITNQQVIFTSGASGIASNYLSLQGSVHDINEALRNVLYTAPVNSTLFDQISVSAHRIKSYIAPTRKSFQVRLYSFQY